MRRIGVGLALTCVLLLASAGLAAAQAPSPYGAPGFAPYPGHNAAYTYGYQHGFYTGYGYGYAVGYDAGYAGRNGSGGACDYSSCTYYPTYAGQAFRRFGGGNTYGGDQGPYLRLGGGYIIDAAHSWGMAGW